MHLDVLIGCVIIEAFEYVGKCLSHDIYSGLRCKVSCELAAFWTMNEGEETIVRIENKQ